MTRARERTHCKYRVPYICEHTHADVSYTIHTMHTASARAREHPLSQRHTNTDETHAQVSLRGRALRAEGRGRELSGRAASDSSWTDACVASRTASYVYMYVYIDPRTRLLCVCVVVAL